MVCFLTSSPVIPGTLELNPANSFMDELHRRFQSGGRVLFICSNPDVYDKTDFFANATKEIFENAGFSFGSFCILDSRNERKAPELVKNSDLIILAGGHVTTQNRFFNRIGLRGLLKDYTGILIGISAGRPKYMAIGMKMKASESSGTKRRKRHRRTISMTAVTTPASIPIRNA